MRSRVGLPVIGVALLGVGVWAGEVPKTVSPGSATGTVVEGRCPTFIWGAVAGAQSYELVVYRAEDGSEEEKPLWRQELPGSAPGWTPSLDRCLERGQRYAWSVRAVGGKEESEWSPPSLFQIAVGPSEAEFEAAFELVRQYVRDSGASVSRNADRPVSVQARGRNPGSLEAVGPTPLPMAAGDSALQVNGAAVVTTATIRAGLCEVLNYRYMDLANGTVLDCDTGKIWLKDASCLGQASWVDTGDGVTIFTKVADLNGGTEDFGCSEYTAGTHTDWEVPAMADMCGLWTGTCDGRNCCTASQGIVDRAFTQPSVANAAGDGQWRPDHAFVGVQSDLYWTIDQWDGTSAWRVWLDNANVFIAPKNNPSYVWPVRSGE